MKRVEFEIPGVFKLVPDIFRDRRGFFFESYNDRVLRSLGVNDVFVQDNQSHSVRNTVRGLHYQLRYPQAKLCRVVKGAAFDVAVDIRHGSPWFGQWVGVVLSDTNCEQIYIPPGFAHGFAALTEEVEFLYKCSEYYHCEDEFGLAWDDPSLAIDWKVETPLLSDKDLRNRRLGEIPSEVLPCYEMSATGAF